MTLIVDASVAVPWYLPEATSEAAERILARDDLIAPEWVLAEIANAIWKRVRKNEVSAEDAAAILDHAKLDFTALVAAERLIVPAMKLAIAHNHPVYDCLYVALSLQEGAPLATDDRRLAGLAEQLGITVLTLR